MRHSNIFLRILALTFLVCVDAMSAKAQAPDLKFGKISREELTMQNCSLDTAAEAIVLGDVGQSYFEYEENKGFVLVFERYVRLKILNTDGYHWAEFEIPLYQEGNSKEQVISLKGKTWNLEGGKAEDTKLTGESEFDEKVSRNWMLKKVSMPGVRVGSVIELKYSIKSPFLSNLQEWKFQQSIPVLWSEYEIRIPEYFKFSRNATGYVPYVVNEYSSIPKSISEVYAVKTGSTLAPQTQHKTSTITYTEYSQRIAARNVSAMKEESFTSTVENYQAKIEYELFSYRFPGESVHEYSTSWEKIIDLLLKDDDFGIQLNRGSIIRRSVAEIQATTVDPLEKAALALNEARALIKWNGKKSKYVSTTIGEALSEKVGSAGDINLLLVLLLKELGLEAYPVILSTRDNGIIYEHHPEIDGFNYVIALLSIDGKEYLLDATENYTPFGLIPFRCLNGVGLVVDRSSVRWIKLTANDINTNTYYAEMKLSPGEGVEGTLTISSSGYSGVDVRTKYHKEGASEYTRWLKERRKDWEVIGIEFASMDTLSIPVRLIYTIKSDEAVTDQGGLFFFNVLMNYGEKSNPFKTEKRDYPVDFGSPIKEIYTFFYEIPDGYQVESLPSSLAISLPDKGGTYRFSASQVNNKILINSILSITKTLYVPDEYRLLREFFARMVEKQAEQIVIKER